MYFPKKEKNKKMKTLKTTIAILVLTIVSTATFAQNGLKNAKPEEIRTSLKISPMQMADGIVVLKFANQPQGNYTVNIADANGTVLMTQSINYDATAPIETVKFGKTLAGGTYTVEVVKPDNTKKTETVMLLM